MAQTSSIAFPNMIDPVRNTVNTYEDNQSVVNRSRLLLLTEPTELYNEPTFGAGLRRFIWQYNTVNNKARIKDKIIEQLDTFEPCVDATKTTFADGLLFTEGALDVNDYSNMNNVKMTVALKTKFGADLSIDFSDLQAHIDQVNSTL